MRKQKPKRGALYSVPLVAIDIGSYSIKAMAATCPQGETLHILASEEIVLNKKPHDSTQGSADGTLQDSTQGGSDGAMHDSTQGSADGTMHDSTQGGTDGTSQDKVVSHGIIKNSSEMSSLLRNILNDMSNSIEGAPKLPSAFVTIGGKTMRLARIPVKRMLGRRLPVSESIIEGMEQECRSKVERDFKKYNYTTLEIEPIEFLLDNQIQYERPTPQQKAKYIEATYMAFVGIPDISEQVLGSFARTSINIEQIWARPTVQAYAIIENRQEAEYAIIDFGDQTTTCFIYYHGHFMYCKTIPLGGAHITRDIEQCGISESNARKVKHHYAYASTKAFEKDLKIVMPLQNSDKKLVMRLSEISEVVVARLDEILNRFFQDLDEEYKKYISKIFITGGGAKLKGLTEYLTQKTGMPVEFGKHYDWLYEQTPKEYEDPKYTALVGTLLMADEYRRTNGSYLTSDDTSQLTGWRLALAEMKKRFAMMQQGVIDFFESNDNPKKNSNT